MRSIFAIFLGLLALSGCSSGPPVQSSSRLSVLRDSVMPTPNRTDLVAPDRLSLIGPSDTIAIEVFNVPELSREVQVDAGGRVTLPLIGTMDVAGKTAEELSGLIESKLRATYVKNPDVTVNLKTSVSQFVTVDGSVDKPGLYPVTNQMTLLRAVASSGGVTEFAKLDDVVVLRSVNGQQVAGLYNLTAIRRGLYDDPPIFANDVVVVGDSPARRIFKDIIGTAPLIGAPLVALIQR